MLNPEASPYEWMEAVKSKAAKKMLSSKLSKCFFGVARKGPGEIYIVKKYKENVFKVGLSCDAEQRRKGLQTGNETPLILAVVYEVQNMQDAENRALEALAFCRRDKMFPEIPDWVTEWCDVPYSGGLEKVDDIVTEAIGDLLNGKERRADFDKI